MRIVISSLLLGSAAIAFAAPAMAQDTDRAPFTGPRAGVILGYDGTRPGSTADSDIAGDNQTASGLLYGGDVGYDVGVGRFVIGAEAELTGSTAKVNNSPIDPNNFGYGRVKAGRDLYAGARLGMLVGPKTMLYAKGGYTNARFDLTASDGTTETGRHYNLDGYRVGAGIEHALTPNSYAKIEYRYSNYGNARLEYPNGTNTNNFSVDTDRHQVAVGFGFRF
ncbi:outer membrane protein [Sphingomonas sp. 28-63-12]|uniref:outer membrane protein n=1 Tax=Sphingomonas sp. 28-63-12 TaxID=1970434 RepID=UPI000BD08E9F|nr:MAG: hypothetical protein B7Y47_10650 [Sphingomonas sp. 28-63-12]